MSIEAENWKQASSGGALVFTMDQLPRRLDRSITEKFNFHASMTVIERALDKLTLLT
jgi:hypothetical protein